MIAPSLRESFRNPSAPPSADAEMRFLSITPDLLPSEDELELKPFAELAVLVQRAKPLSR